jgi:hypothetical protein
MWILCILHRGCSEPFEKFHRWQCDIQINFPKYSADELKLLLSRMEPLILHKGDVLFEVGKEN